MPEPVERTMQCRRMQLNESPSNSTPSNSTPSKLSKTTLCRPRCRRLRPHSGRRARQRRARRIQCCRTPDRLSRSDTSSAASATTEILPAFAVDDVTLGGGMALGAGSQVMQLEASPSNTTPLQFYPRLLAVWPLARSNVWPSAVRSSGRWCSSQRRCDHQWQAVRCQMLPLLGHPR